MAGYDKYHDELVMVPKGSVGKASGMGDLSAAERAMLRNEAIQENVKRDIKISKQAPERRAAVKKATTETENGVKVTKYPYVEPSAKRQSYRSLDDTLQDLEDVGLKKGGRVKKMAKGGSVKSNASKRADGCAQRGKTKGRMV